jgi:hypothetical protein
MENPSLKLPEPHCPNNLIPSKEIRMECFGQHKPEIEKIFLPRIYTDYHRFLLFKYLYDLFFFEGGKTPNAVDLNINVEGKGSQVNLPLVRFGDLFSQVGEPFPKVGELFPKVGELFPQVGEPFSKVGELFPKDGEPFPKVGELFPKVGEPIPKVGGFFPKVGELFPRVSSPVYKFH